MTDNVPEDQCKVCSTWPTAERASLRQEHFSTDYIRMPHMGVCIFCQIAFWTGMGSLTPDEPPKH